MIRKGEARVGAIEWMGKRVCGECKDDLREGILIGSTKGGRGGSAEP